MKTDVTKVMTDEHTLILRMIALVEQNTALMEQGRFRDWTFFLDAVDFIRHYADRFHHAKEEDVLFVELIANGMPEKQSPIEAMHLEHEQGRAHVRALQEAAHKAWWSTTRSATRPSPKRPRRNTKPLPVGGAFHCFQRGPVSPAHPAGAKNGHPPLRHSRLLS